jgi:hypothetical protein
VLWSLLRQTKKRNRSSRNSKNSFKNTTSTCGTCLLRLCNALPDSAARLFLFPADSKLSLSRAFREHVRVDQRAPSKERETESEMAPNACDSSVLRFEAR